MTYEIEAVKTHVYKIFKELKDIYNKNDFKFGAVFYRDKISTKGDEDEFFPLTNDIKDLEKKISKVRVSGGGVDRAEDWVRGYELASKKMNWRKGIKLIIHICDEGAHGEKFTNGDPFNEEGEKLISQIKECVEKNINIIGFKIGEIPEKSFEKIKEIYNEHKMIDKDYGHL